MNKIIIPLTLIIVLSTSTGFIFSRFTQNMDVRVNAKDLPEHGLVIIKPSDPLFDSLAADALRGLSASEIESVKPLSVLITNTSGKTVVAHTIIWQCTGPNGEQRSFKKIYANSEALTDGLEAFESLSGTTSDKMIKPGAARLFSLLPLRRGSAEGAGTREAGAENQVGAQSGGPDLRRFSSELLAKYSEVTVVIDGVFFDDGTFAGPDATNFFDKMRAQVSAKRDLINDVAAGIEGGKSNDEIFRDIEEKAKLAAPPNPIDAPMFDEQYKFWRKEFASHLLGSRKAQGDDKTLATALHTLRKPQVKLLKKEGKK